MFILLFSLNLEPFAFAQFQFEWEEDKEMDVFYM
jgi:hypothetical protein